MGCIIVGKSLKWKSGDKLLCCATGIVTGYLDKMHNYSEKMVTDKF
jgi:hypothetical protein